MNGQLLDYNYSDGVGVILGDDGLRYQFTGGQVVSGWPLSNGQRIRFQVAPDGVAYDIHAVFNGASSGAALRGSFDMGRVINRTFTAIRKNAAIFFGASAVMVGIPSILMSAWQLWAVSGNEAFSGMVLIATLIGYVCYVVGSYLFQGLVVKASFDGFGGKSTSFSTAYDAGVRRLLPLIGLAIISSIAIGFATLLLIVPGIILLVMWIVAAPVLMVEKRGVFDSLGRAKSLSKGYRWHILGVLFIYFILAVMVQTAISALAIGIGVLIGSPVVMQGIMAIVINVLTSVVTGAGVAALYYELRTVKEGAPVEDLAAVFD